MKISNADRIVWRQLREKKKEEKRTPGLAENGHARERGPRVETFVASLDCVSVTCLQRLHQLGPGEPLVQPVFIATLGLRIEGQRLILHRHDPYL
jgi:hypothetical protein